MIYIYAMIEALVIGAITATLFEALVVLATAYDNAADYAKPVKKYMVIVAGILAFFTSLGRWDDSDNKDELIRSDMRILTDHLTGCEYLNKSGLTPRLDSDGNHICNKGELP